MHTNPTTPADNPPLQTLSREAFWQRHVAHWRESGLSKAAYCEQYSLVYHQMVYWCTKARSKADDKVEGVPSDFVPVAVVPTVDRTCALSVRLGNGMAIEGIDEHSVSLVGKLIEQL